MDITRRSKKHRYRTDIYISCSFIHAEEELAACKTNRLTPTPDTTIAAPTFPSVFGTELFIVESVLALNAFNSPAKDSIAILLDRPANTITALPPDDVVSSFAKATTLCRGSGVVSVEKMMPVLSEDELYCWKIMLSAVSEARRDSVLCWP